MAAFQVNRSLKTRLALGAALCLPPAAVSGRTSFTLPDPHLPPLQMPAPPLSISPTGAAAQDTRPSVEALTIEETGNGLLRIADSRTGDAVTVPKELLARPSRPPSGFRLSTDDVRKFLNSGASRESYQSLLEASPDLSALPIETRSKLIRLLALIDEKFSPMPPPYRTHFYATMHGGESVGDRTGAGRGPSRVLGDIFHSVKVACVPLAERLDSSLLSENEWRQFSKASSAAGGGAALPLALAVPSDSATGPVAVTASALFALMVTGAGYLAWRGRHALKFWGRQLLGLPPPKDPPGFEVKQVASPSDPRVR